MEVPVVSFCNGRFESLKDEISEFVLVKDWAKLDALEVAGLVSPKLKMLAAILHRELEQQGMFDRVEQDFSSQRRVLNWARTLTSKELPFGRSLESALIQLEREPKELDNLSDIDLRYCNLLDPDAGDVCRLCEMAFAKGSGNRNTHVVDVSGNRFSELAIPKLAAACKFAYVYVPDVGHAGAKDQLAGLTDEQLESFIFIRQPHLKAEGWHAIVSENNREVVLRAHQQFYETYPKFSSFRA